MLILSQASQFYSSYAAFFLIMNGTYLIHVTGELNLNSMAKKKFEWFQWEPVIFATLIFVDSSSLVNSQYLLYLYCVYFGASLMSYISFMWGFVQQTKHHLGIGLFSAQVADEKKTQ